MGIIGATMVELTLLLFIVLFVGLFVLGPFVLIWALNTLFPLLAIEYSFINWIAVCVIHLFFSFKISFRK